MPRQSRLRLSSLLASLLFWLPPALLPAATYYVAPPASGGNNSNPGTLASPFATIQRAATAAVAGDTVLIRAGTYRETVTPAASGTSTSPITFRNYGNEVVTLNGTDVLSSATWTLDSGSIYHTPLDASFFSSTFNQALQVFVDGEMVTLAKWPDLTTKTNAYPSGIAEPVDLSHPAKSTTTSFVSKTRNTSTNLTTGVVVDTALPPKPAGFYDGAEIYFQPNNQAWSWIFSGVVTQVPANGNQITFTTRSESGKDFNQSTYDAASRYYLFNKKEFLDTPGEWWHDRTNGRLYLWAPSSASPASNVVEVKKREFAFNLSDRSYITIQGLRLFACSISTDTASGGSALGYDASGNVIYPWRGSSYLAPSTGVVIDGIRASYLNHFTDVSGHFFLQWGTCTGIVLSGTGHTIRNSTIEKSAGNGIELLGHGHIVFNNTLLDLAYAGTDAAAINTVAAGTGTDHVVSYNTIRRTGRSGITPRSIANSNAAGGQFKARYHHNDIAYFGLQDWDVGGFYAAVADGKFVRIDHNVISEGRGFISAGVYLDYAKNYIIHHNVVWNVEWGIKLQGQSGGLNNTLVYNNTSSVRNLSSTPYGPFAIGNGSGTNVGTVLRNNLLTLVTPPSANGYNPISNGTFASAEIAANLAWDGIPSSSTDPRFIAPATVLDASGVNFQLQSGSAAIDTGSVIGPYVRDGITVPAFPDAVTGSAPDIGAYEFGAPLWRAGANSTDCAPPEFSATPGSYTGSVTLALGTPTVGATIRYTVDGTTPTATTGLLYTAPLLISTSTTVRALATAPGLADSEVVSGVFDIIFLEVSGNGTVIPLHDISPQPADHTHFGSIESGFASVTRTFTLRNISASTVNLTGATPLTLTGSTDFALLDQPALALAAGASTTFRVRYTPTSAGSATAILRIAQANLPGGLYDFTIAGTGLAAQPALALNPSALTIYRPANSTSSAALTLANAGRAPLTWSLSAPITTGLFSVSDSATGGTAFAWRDTVTGGTSVLPNTDDNTTGAVFIGFSFPYLGNSYSQVYICSNGFISFTSGGGSAFNNFALPNTSLVPQTIALLWDDLATDASSSITWKQLDAQTFGVTYQNAYRIGNAATQRTTAQILLKSDGRVILQYKDNTIPSGYTIGYQTTSSVGHTIAHDTAFLSTGTGLNRALTLLPPAPWLSSPVPASGIVAPGTTQTVAVPLTTSGLIAGSPYTSTLTLTTNDLAALTTLIPISLTISNLPSPPAGLRLTVNSSTELGLVWADLASNETGFLIERSLDGATAWTQIAQLPTNSTAYQDAGLPSGALRHYRVRSTNASGNSAWSAIVTNAPAPLPYFLYQPFDAASGTAAASLAPVPGILSYSGTGAVNDTATLAYPGRTSSGRGFATANTRFFMTLDTSLPALAPYVSGGRVGGTGTGVLYVSWLARGINAQEANAVEFRSGTSADTDNTISIGTTFGNSYIRAMSANALNGGIQNYATSTKTPSAGTDLYVAKFTFGAAATTRVDVYINQTTEGTPDITTTGYGQFNVLGFAKFGTAAAPAIDEFRFSTTYAGALPVENTAPITPGPTLSALGPDFGPTSGGTTVTLAGTGFSGVLGVTFGGLPATSFQVLSPTQINAVTPARSAGVFHVAVTTLDGTATLPDAFTYASLTPMQLWYASYGLPTDGNGDGASTADPDGDGVGNLIEYALESDPASSASRPVLESQISDSKLQISFLRARSELTYLVESSGDLVTWTNVSYTPVAVGQTQTVQDTEPVSTATSPRRFLRLKVTAP